MIANSDEDRDDIEASTPQAYDVAEPPFYGTGEVLVWETQMLCSLINRDRLFKNYWGGAGLPELAYQQVVQGDFGPAFDRLTNLICEENLIEGRGYYGFFPVIVDNDEVVLLDPGDYHTEQAVLHLPTPGDGTPVAGAGSIVSFLRPEGDVVGVQTTTIGSGFLDRSRQLLERGDAQSAERLLGVARYLGNHLAERLTTEIRRALLLPAEQGRRYSFGSAGMAGVSDLATFLDLVGAEDRLGISIGADGVLAPLYSTAAVFIRHPLAA